MWHVWGRGRAYRVFVLKPGGKRPLGKPRHRWQDDNIMDFASNRWEGMDWSNVAQHMDMG
jgi:hypothetical protein